MPTVRRSLSRWNCLLGNQALVQMLATAVTNVKYDVPAVSIHIGGIRME
jgi:hypothetical protein